MGDGGLGEWGGGLAGCCGAGEAPEDGAGGQGRKAGEAQDGGGLAAGLSVLVAALFERGLIGARFEEGEVVEVSVE